MALDDYIHGRDERAVLERKMRAEGRLPPGQSLTLKWPVLHDGEVPEFDPAKWDFRVGGLVEGPLSLTWPELLGLPHKAVTSDFHCVTRWSTFDNRWEGVPVQAVLERARPQREATHVMVCGHKGDARYGYTTNLPLADLDRPDVLLVLRNNGQDLDPEHGGPLRLVVPHLYAWKSAKWVRGLTLTAQDEPGFWERYGYHNYGDPWKEQRYWSD